MIKTALHPGEILKDELDELGLSLAALARQIDVPANRLSQIVNGKRSITGDTALRLGHWFDMNPQFWLNLQTQYDLNIAAEDVGHAIYHLPTRESFENIHDS